MPAAQTPLHRRLDAALAALQNKSRLRQLKSSAGIDFASNDYLGLSTHPALRDTLIATLQNGTPVGSSASRLLRGNHNAHSDFEEFAADWLGVEKTLLFDSGFKANYAVLTTLPSRHDLIIYDEDVHASMREGIQHSHAKSVRIVHNDLNQFSEALQNARAEQIFVCVESLYSMSGDHAPLQDLHNLCLQHGAILIVDEAHATGIHDARGRGLTEHLSKENLITVHTGGKALGVSGGWIAGDAIVIDYLINAARPFIYSTAPMPLLPIALKRAVQLIDEEPERRAKLQELCLYAEQQFGLKRKSWSPILPITLGTDEAAIAVAENLQARGFDVRAIRPPTVKEGHAQLRVSMNINRSEDEIAELADLVKEQKK